MVDEVYSVLFVCTGNSARSIIAEALMNHLGAGRFRAYSAGSQPSGAVYPFALQALAKWSFPTQGLRSKSWEEFARPDTPQLDFVFTVCDAAAGEVCPIGPAQPMSAHWGLPDPAAIEGTDERKAKAFLDTAMGRGARGPNSPPHRLHDTRARAARSDRRLQIGNAKVRRKTSRARYPRCGQ